MNASHTSSRFAQPRALPAGLNRLIDEVIQFAKAVLSPSTVVVEVEQMQTLWAHARRCETSDPMLAAQLRRRAAGIGLR
ncbi:MAG: hypothetical protein Q8N44_00015 [Rubrivivax sp.]|nr:hypothetical protein [Rubrivivax sp.]